MKGGDEARCPNCGLTIRRDAWYSHYSLVHPRLDAPAFEWVRSSQQQEKPKAYPTIGEGQ